MKVKGERVLLAVFGKDRTFRFVKGIKLKDDIIMLDGKAYGRFNNSKNSLIAFINARLEPAQGESVPIDQLYTEYKRFCEEYGYDIVNSDKFVKIIDEYLDVDAVQGIVRNVRIANRTIKVDKDTDIYIYEKSGLFRKKKIPVYVVVEGIPKTLTFDELKGYAMGANGELVTLDDFTLGQMLSESMFIGATIGTQKLFGDIKWLTIVSIAFSLIGMVLTCYCLFYISQIWDILKKLL